MFLVDAPRFEEPEDTLDEDHTAWGSLLLKAALAWALWCTRPEVRCHRTRSSHAGHEMTKRLGLCGSRFTVQVPPRAGMSAR